MTLRNGDARYTGIKKRDCVGVVESAVAILSRAAANLHLFLASFFSLLFLLPSSFLL